MNSVVPLSTSRYLHSAEALESFKDKFGLSLWGFVLNLISLIIWIIKNVLLKQVVIN